MKKWVALFVACVLAVSVMSLAAADELEGYKVSTWSISLNENTNTLAYRPEDSDFYTVIDAEGNVLAGEEYRYTYMSPWSNGFRVEVASVDGIHKEGYIDGQGKVLVPPRYADVKLISDRWQAGVKLVSCSAEDKDYTYTNYSTDEKYYYRVDTVDMFFDGEQVGSLTRSEYGGGYFNAYNTYISVQNIEGRNTYYNSSMEKCTDTTGERGEYTEHWSREKTTVIHNGTGQEAFVPSCTLTPEEVSQSYYYNSNDKTMYDLQGNVIFTLTKDYLSVYTFYNGYAKVRTDDLYGIIDMQGTEVIPAEYDDFDYVETLGTWGYVGTSKDGKFCFLDAQGNAAVTSSYAADLVSVHGTFAEVKDMDGSLIVLTAGAGELKEHFADASYPSYYGSFAFVGTNSDGQKCLIDMYGHTLIPYREDVRSIEASIDGKVVLVGHGDGTHTICQFDTSNTEPAFENIVGGAEDGTWTCVNGHTGNTGKFCPECGAPKPDDAE